MKRPILIFLAAAAFIGACWGAFQAARPAQPALSRFVPEGALLYLQAKDFSSLLSAWSQSNEKQLWLKSNNFEVFSRSRLFLRLNDASKEFSSAAGIPADTNLLRQVAGQQSALAIFDIGKLQFLYITRLPSASSMQSTLWQTRSKFETRNAGGVQFFVRRDPDSEREVAFAVNGDYLLLATREDLLAGALELMANTGANSIETESWWDQSVAAATTAKSDGDLRMVLNLDKIAPSPYFRSYWIEPNIPDLKNYSAAISDLSRSGPELREDRILLRKAPIALDNSAAAGSAAVADLVRFVPAQAGVYQAAANPAPSACLGILETKILAPHLGPAVAAKLAPEVQLSNGETGAATDLETRIDQPPVAASVSVDSTAPLQKLFADNPLSAVLGVQSTELNKDGVFVRIHSAIAFLGQSEWNEAAIRSSLVDFVRSGLTTGDMGVEWQDDAGHIELNGLWTLAVSVRGKYLLVSDSAELLTRMEANANKNPQTTIDSAAYVAGFDYQHERDNFARLTGLLDNQTSNPASGHIPNFFSENIGSLSSTLAGLSSEKIVIREAADKENQTVTYQWAR